MTLQIRKIWKKFKGICVCKIKKKFMFEKLNEFTDVKNVIKF